MLNLRLALGRAHVFPQGRSQRIRRPTSAGWFPSTPRDVNFTSFDHPTFGLCRNHHLHLKLSLPAKRFSSFVERYKILLACSLVNRTWRELGQAELFRDVALWNSPRAVKFLAALEGTGWGPRVRSLRFGHREREGAWTKSNTGSDNFVDSFVLGKVLRATPEAETV